MDFKKIAIRTGIAGALVMGLAACPSNNSDSTQEGQAAQEDNMQRAVDAVPVPQVTQFTTRETVSRWIQTQNEPDQTHFVYVMLPGVGFVGYYVADSAPVNICTSITPPMREYELPNQADPIGPAPGIDGVYYGGSGCGMWYFFDTTTGAKIEIGGDMAFFTTNQPLTIDAPRLEVAVETEEE